MDARKARLSDKRLLSDSLRVSLYVGIRRYISLYLSYA